MNRIEVIQLLEETGVIAVIRAKEEDDLDGIVKALLKGGVRALEITMTTPYAVDVIKNLCQTVKLEEPFLIGAGTVLDAETAQSVIHAGASFIVSPIYKTELVHMAHRYDRPIFPGAFTPTEILNAWEGGADVVKVFPAGRFGPKYFRDIHGPLPQIKLTPTGGVNLDNVADFIKNGASFVGVGTALLDKTMIANHDWDALAQHARKFIEAVKQGRNV